MNRLWVRLSVMIAGVLLMVFLLQFASIMLTPVRALPSDAAGAESLPFGGPGQEPRAEIARRLLNFMGLSALVGLVGGVLIARVVTRPVTEIAAVARRLGAGERGVRVKPLGSREMVELAQSFNQMADDLQHAETVRTNLMADVSHELRTPLAVLDGNLRAALDHVYALDEAEIANLYSQTRYLIRLVNDLRELALAEAHQLPLQKQQIVLAELVAETVQALGPVAGERGIALTDETTGLPELAVDPVRLRQVLFNLLTNALRHTPAGGEVRVRGEATDAEVRLIVADTGEGLEPEALRYAFDRFYRADKSRSRETGGSGLGLAIVKAIVEAHGGRVEAASGGKGLGSTFTVVLPRA